VAASPTFQNAAVRLGSLYRVACFGQAGVAFEGPRILDVGSHDTTLLGQTRSPMCIALDLERQPVSTVAHVTQGDGCRLPFGSGVFDHVVAADVIEHVTDDAAFAAELQRVTRSGGEVFLTTPSAHIRMMPPFLTNYISRRWGHYDRIGYTAEQLASLTGPDFDCTITEWNAPAMRTWYLPVRLLSVVWPWLAASLWQRAAAWDARHTEGDHGFYWVRWRRRGQ
jgi:SAM-dependent methyltransferase